MTDITDWLYNEFDQVGKDYGLPKEVAVYDESHASFRDVAAESQAILESLSVIAGQTLLDIGCGTGFFAIEAAQRGLSVIAVDVSDAMLKYAAEKADAKAVTNVQFVRGGFLNLPDNIKQLDYVVTSFSFHHLPDFWKQIALKRIHSLLSDSGKLFIQDVVLEEHYCVENINAFVDTQHQLGGEFLRIDAIGHFREEYSTYSWILEQMLERTGFIIESKELKDGLFARYLCAKAV